MINLDNFKKIEGMLNFLSGSENFLDNHDIIFKTKLFKEHEINSLSPNKVLLYFVKEKDLYVDVNIGKRAFFNLKDFISVNTKCIPNFSGLFNSIISFSDMEILLSFVPLYAEGTYMTYMLLKKGESDYCCFSCRLSDVLCLTQKMGFPIFFHKNIIKTKGKVIKNEKE